ncbi:MAG: hypothetical protein RLZZ385_1372 [Pseudomonadota bacterium]|jgi:hypothetical protein
MIFPRKNISALAAGVALGLTSLVAQAADQPSLGSVGAGATFTGGATINNGASYLSTVPAADALDLVATIKPAAADVGKQGNLVVIMDVKGLGFFNLLSGGIWVQWNGDPATIQPFKKKTLAASESVTILNDLIGQDTNLTNAEFKAYVGYYMASVADIKYSANPAAVAISAPPAASCPANTTAGIGNFAGKPVCVLSSANRITTNTHLTANFSYRLDGTVFIGENTATPNDQKITLTIDAGTTIFAPEGVNTLVIDKSAKIMANGSPSKPIVFTSEVDVPGVDSLNTRGRWGGLVINGVARLNTSSGFDNGEGSTGQYGGGTTPNDDDSSGAVTYAQIKYAGYPITSTNELNSVALQGVGRGTILDYIHIHNGADDAIEFYGGTVNAKHLVLTGTDDDALDWTSGYIGKIQHVVIKQTNRGDNCIEADNLGSNPTATPRSIPQIANLTCVGSTGIASSGHAFELKAGTGMNMRNSVVGGPFVSTEGCIFFDTLATFTNSGATIAALNGTLTMTTSRIDSACNLTEKSGINPPWTGEAWFAAQSGSAKGTVDLGGPKGWANGSSLNAVVPSTTTDPFFDNVDYIGAVKDDSSDWTKGWSFSF